MSPRQITADFAVAPQIAVSEIPNLHAAGFRSIICNRPDGEDSGQPPYAAIEAAAKAAGMEARHLPVRPGQMTASDVDTMRSLIDSLPKPVLAYCRSGARSTALWQAAQQAASPSSSSAQSTDVGLGGLLRKGIGLVTGKR